MKEIRIFLINRSSLARQIVQVCGRCDAAINLVGNRPQHRVERADLTIAAIEDGAVGTGLARKQRSGAGLWCALPTDQETRRAARSEKMREVEFGGGRGAPKHRLQRRSVVISVGGGQQSGECRIAAQFQQGSAGWARCHALGQTSATQGTVDAKARAVVFKAGEPRAFDELVQSARAGTLGLRIRV